MVSAFLTQVDLKVYERILFIDADIDFSADDVAKLWNLDLPVAVAAYSMKRMDNPLSAWRNGKLVEITDDMKEPFEVDYAGTGFMMIKREVLERMIDWSHAEYEKIRARLKSAGIDPQELGDWLRLPVTHEEAHVGTCYAIFDCGVVDDGAGAFYSSEDYWFCRKIRQMGEKIVMDPTIRLGHWGTFRYGAR